MYDAAKLSNNEEIIRLTRDSYQDNNLTEAIQDPTVGDVEEITFSLEKESDDRLSTCSGYSESTF